MSRQDMPMCLRLGAEEQRSGRIDQEWYKIVCQQFTGVKVKLVVNDNDDLSNGVL